MSTAVWVALGVVAAVVASAVTSLLTNELLGWLDLVPRGILHLAAMLLNPAQRKELYEEEWLPELLFILRKAEGRPITRLVLGVTYALGCLIAARRVARLRTTQAGVRRVSTQLLRWTLRIALLPVFLVLILSPRISGPPTAGPEANLWELYLGPRGWARRRKLPGR